jgi:hypothetical protein
MAKLADVTFETRIILKVLAGISILAVVILIFIRGGQFVIDNFFTPPKPAELEFGKLPSIQFPKQNAPVLKYTINTLDGQLPFFPPRMNVYKIKKNEPSIVSLRRARVIVSNAGYINNETKINDAVYQWADLRGRRIEYNILTNNFKIQSDYSNATTFSDYGKRLLSKDGAFETAVEILRGFSEDTSDLDQQKTELVFLKLDDGRIVQAENQNDAQFVRVDLFQKNIEDQYPVYYPAPKQSIMYVVLKSEAGFPTVSEANYVHYRLDPNNVSDYYIKTAEQAFDDLVKGRGYVWVEDKKRKEVDITDISLGYFLGEQNQNFFIPIVIFKGNGFLAYVQAIPDELVEE